MASAAAGTGGRGVGWRAWCVLALAWFATVQVRPLFDPDEGRYAEIPREMAASGDWVTPRLDGLKYFEKPPLQYWATALVYSGFGVSEWSSRLWSCVLAFACLPLTFFWVRRGYGREAGLAALTALAVSPFFVLIGHLNLLDAGFTFFLCAAIFSFTHAQRSPPRGAAERRWMLAAWAAAGLAVLSKGIVVFVLAGTTLIAYCLLERDGSLWRRLHWMTGLPVLLLIAAPWFAMVSMRNPDFAQFFFIHEHFARYLTTVHQRVEPWWFFLPLLAIGVLPWAGRLVQAAGAAWGGVRTADQFKPLKFLLIFSLVTLLFFSASGSKLAPYILPMLPPLAAISGAHTPPELYRGAARAGAGLLIMVIGLGLAFCYQTVGSLPAETVLWSLGAAVLAVIAVLLTRRSARLPDPQRAAVVTAVGAILAWQCLLTAYGFVPPARSGRDLAQAVRPAIGPDTPLYSVGQYRETLSPYLARTLTLVGYGGELEFGLRAEPGRQSVSPARFEQEWSQAASAVAFFEPARWEEYRARGFNGRVIAADGRTVAVSRR